jgi:deoxyadenosine/deoxycytidine kinase
MSPSVSIGGDRLASRALPSFIAVAGNMAVGKTTLVGRLAEGLDTPGFAEIPEQNPFLARFYEDPDRWAFHAQVGFLNLALGQYAQVANAGRRGVVERTIDEHHDVFAAQLRAEGALSVEEFAMLGELHRVAATSLVLCPDLVIYLHADPAELLTRIEARGREVELQIDPEYLRALDRRYQSFASSWSASPLVAIDTLATDLRTEDGFAEVIDEASRFEASDQRYSSSR